MKGQQRERDLSCIHENLIFCEFGAGYTMLLNQLSETATLGIFHDYVNILVLLESVVELDNCWTCDDTKKFDLPFSTLFIFLW